MEAMKVTDAETCYPCQKCGKARTKAEGGTTFTVCDECWDKQHGGNTEGSVTGIPVTDADRQAARKVIAEVLDEIAGDVPGWVSGIAQALATAREQGRKQGREEAAAIAEAEVTRLRLVLMQNPRSDDALAKVREAEWIWQSIVQQCPPD
jgi:hypothetical protein